MTDPAAQEPPRWHQALAYAVTGRGFPELGRQPSPDLGFLGRWLVGQNPDVGAGALAPVPDELMRGIGPAQFWAALTRLRTELGSAGRTAASVTADRPLDAEERRLLTDVPPHHGS